MVFYKFLVFSTKTHVRFKISISQLKLPQNLIITYQNLLSSSWITCNLFSCDNCPSFSARLNQRGVLFWATRYTVRCNYSLFRSKDNQRNGLETQAKALMTSVIRSDTLYFGTL